MWKKLLLSIIVMVFCVTCVAFFTWAICEQENLEGRWPVRVGTTDDFEKQCWEECNLTIDVNGVITEGGIYTDCYDQTSDITGGQLTLYPNCVIEGIIDTSNGTLYIDFGSIVGDEVILRKSMN